MAQPKAHDRTRPEVVDEEDPVEKMLMKTGCIDLHYAVQVVLFDRHKLIADDMTRQVASLLCLICSTSISF